MKSPPGCGPGAYIIYIIKRPRESNQQLTHKDVVIKPTRVLGPIPFTPMAINIQKVDVSACMAKFLGYLVDVNHRNVSFRCAN